MTEVRNADYGTFGESGGAYTLRWERTYSRPIATVWAALTEPERLNDWLGACEVEPRVGGRFDVFVNRDADTQVTGRVLRWEPPRVLEFTWKGHEEETETIVRAELSEAEGGGTRMVFTHRGMERKWLGLTLPGWHSLLMRLDSLMREGRSIPDSSDRWRDLQRRYLERYGIGDTMTEPPQPMEKYKMDESRD